MRLDHLLLEKDNGGAAIITLNRPERRNALSLTLMNELRATLERLAADAAVRVVVLAATGKVFCSGHDLNELTGQPRADYEALFAECTALMQTIQSIPQPVIAEVRGLATAAGCQLVATCDLALGDESAAFATPGVRIGLFCSTPMVAVTRAIGRLETTNGGGPNPRDIRNVANDKGASSFDQRFNSTTSFVFDVPVGKGRRFGKGMPGALDAAIGGWQWSSILNLYSGQPLNLRYPDNAGLLSDGHPDFLGNVALRPNIIDGNAGVRAAGSDYLNYFNRANLVVPPVAAPFGNLGRNVAYGFPLYQTDLVLAKSFRLPMINEGARLQFRGEFYNLFNRTNFTAPTVGLANANFGRSSWTFDPRYVQLGLKLVF
ncbi:MAG: hypothetical protein FJW31_06445 [Acidobacteria bacterium]|nr:hypothetical protein [Acidobacteriota bacterium]